MHEELERLEQDLKRIKEMGYVKDIKKGRGGQLATFFKILNNESICHKIDLKLKKEFTRNYVIIFNARPEYKGKDEVKKLREKYGYFENGEKRGKVLKVSVQANYSTLVGKRFLFKLKVDYEEEMIYLFVYDRNFQLLDCKVGWPFKKLKAIYEKKCKYLVLVKSWEQEIDKVKHYKYYDYYVWQLKSFEEFLKLVEEGTIRVTFKIDIYRRGPKVGCVNDRGVSFEIQELELERLYEK